MEPKIEIEGIVRRLAVLWGSGLLTGAQERAVDQAGQILGDVLDAWRIDPESWELTLSRLILESDQEPDGSE